MTKQEINKRSLPANKKCLTSNEGELYQDPGNPQRVWKCQKKVWKAFRITPALGTSSSDPAMSCKDILAARDQINTCDNSFTVSNKAYNILLTNETCSGTTTRTVQVFCEMEIDGGGWSLVWKHSVLEVGTLSTNMYYHSKHYRACTDIETGWCNIPNKRRFNPTEMLHVGYHNKQIIYAYKGTFNLNIDTDWTGGFLLNATKLVDKCTQGNGIPPMPKIYSGNPDLLGLEFGKRGIYQNERESYCDGYYVSLSSPGECRWWDCLLPSSISSKPWGDGVQRTTAIFVR